MCKVAAMQYEGVYRMYTRSGDDQKGSFGVGMDALLWMKSDWGVTICYALVLFASMLI